MKKAEITIAGKAVTLCYCYATEIAFKTLAERDINDFWLEAVPQLREQRMPDVRQTIFLLQASMTAYYNSLEEQAPVTDKDLMNEATPTELGTALGTVMRLRGEFYAVPADEPADKPTKGRKGKNA